MHPSYYADQIKALKAPRVTCRELTQDSLIFQLRPHTIATLFSENDQPSGKDRATLSVKVNRKTTATFHLQNMGQSGLDLVSSYLSNVRVSF